VRRGELVAAGKKGMGNSSSPYRGKPYYHYHNLTRPASPVDATEPHISEVKTPNASQCEVFLILLGIRRGTIFLFLAFILLFFRFLVRVLHSTYERVVSKDFLLEKMRLLPRPKTRASLGDLIFSFEPPGACILPSLSVLPLPVPKR
jgi:hypothetical protein